MTYCLPPNLLALFTPREPIPFLAPIAKLPHEKKREHQGGIAQLVNLFEAPEDTPAKTKVETKEERKARLAGEKAKLNSIRIQEYLEAALYDPTEITDATSDSFKTLFVARLNFDTSESKLRREFEHYGPIRKIKIVHDLDGKPRGYAFIEYEHERDMRSAYKHADGKKIDGRRVLVDVERARTVEGWLPRRLGGGLGNTRRTLLPKWKRDLGYDEKSERSVSRANNRSSAGESRRRRSRSKERGDRDKDRHSRKERKEEREREKEGGATVAAAGSGGGEDSRSRTGKEKSRSRERKRKRSKSRDREKEEKESKRKRSRSREKKRKRSRDRDRDRGDKDKERDRGTATSKSNGNDDGVAEEIGQAAVAKQEPNGGEAPPYVY
ncbi:U1 small nuclear ribonucleoprotein 70 kDa-like [Symsagittifera roscoffensis]|uniref:U1 small nuclear ribonucleoprotein 70 kDa-like n=1 Tax=Symsagittifera roscoffensis TaxID=84072 RepID=UPI00307BBDB5